MTILSSTQAPMKTQTLAAAVLGVPFNKVVAKTKRIGGGFGGKETRNVFIACACSVAAFHSKQPVRLALSREEDMAISGQRHPFLVGLADMHSLSFFSLSSLLYLIF